MTMKYLGLLASLFLLTACATKEPPSNIIPVPSKEIVIIEIDKTQLLPCIEEKITAKDVPDPDIGTELQSGGYVKLLENGYDICWHTVKQIYTKKPIQ